LVASAMGKRTPRPPSASVRSGRSRTGREPPVQLRDARHARERAARHEELLVMARRTSPPPRPRPRSPPGRGRGSCRPP
jgi:hypothetical protein